MLDTFYYLIWASTIVSRASTHIISNFKGSLSITGECPRGLIRIATAKLCFKQTQGCLPRTLQYCQYNFVTKTDQCLNTHCIRLGHSETGAAGYLRYGGLEIDSNFHSLKTGLDSHFLRVLLLYEVVRQGSPIKKGHRGFLGRGWRLEG